MVLMASYSFQACLISPHIRAPFLLGCNSHTAARVVASSEVLLLVSAVPSLARDSPEDVCVGLCRDVLKRDKGTPSLLHSVYFILLSKVAIATGIYIKLSFAFTQEKYNLSK